MMPTSVLAPMLVVPTQTSFQRHLSSREPNFPPVFSIYLTAWLCKQMGTISCVGTPPRGLLCVHSGKPVCLMLQKRVQLCNEVYNGSPNACPARDSAGRWLSLFLKWLLC